MYDHKIVCQWEAYKSVAKAINSYHHRYTIKPADKQRAWTTFHKYIWMLWKLLTRREKVENFKRMSWCV